MEGFYFDTYVQVKIYARNLIKAKKTIKQLEKEFSRIDQIPVNGINEKVLDTTVIHIIKGSLTISKMTNGFFDPTVDPILSKWNYFKKPVMPLGKEIDSLLSFVDYRKVKVNHNTLSLPKGFSLTLGGSAKGYALNRGKKILNEMGISSGLISAGGDIALIGKKGRKKNWVIGIRDPRDKNHIIGTLRLSNCFIMTSGDYERYFFYNNRRYHHIINPFTGYPARGLQSVTLIGNDGLIDDCLSTALFAMGYKRAAKFAKDNKLEAIMVDSTGKIHKFIKRSKFKKYGEKGS